MKTNKLSNLGWVVAAALGGLMITSGFQENQSKIGVADVSAVVEKSDIFKKNETDFEAMKKAREGVLEFLDTYRVATQEQANKIRDLSIKQNITATEKTELTKAMDDVKAADTKYKGLMTKSNMTADEKVLVTEYAQRSQNMENVLQQWHRAFQSEMSNWAAKTQKESFDKARTTLAEVAKAQGYTVVLEADYAPYGANDLTDAVLKAFNAKK